MMVLLAQLSFALGASCGLAIIGLLFAVNWYVQHHFAGVMVGVFDQDAPFYPREVSADPSAESLTIETLDGLNLRASLLVDGSNRDRGNQPLVVFCPEFGGSRWTARHYAQGLLQAGYTVLTFDFRNQGESECLAKYQPTHWLTEHEVDDVRAVLDYVERRSELRDRFVGLMGISRGGCAALRVAAERQSARAVFVEGVYTLQSVVLLFIKRWAKLHIPPVILAVVPDWHLLSTFHRARRMIESRRGCRFADLEGKLAALRNRDVQFVSGRRDSYVPYEVISAVLAETGHDESRLWTVRSAKHNQARDVDPAGFDERAVELFESVR